LRWKVPTSRPSWIRIGSIRFKVAPIKTGTVPATYRGLEVEVYSHTMTDQDVRTAPNWTVSRMEKAFRSMSRVLPATEPPRPFHWAPTPPLSGELT
jgi:hypothetical protein